MSRHGLIRKGRGHGATAGMVAGAAAKSGLALPVHPALTVADLAYIAEVVNREE